HDVVVLNEAIMRDLGIGVPTRTLRVGERPLEAALPPSIRDLVRGRFQVIPEFLGRRGVVRWERFDGVVRRYRAAIGEVAASRAVAKDPRFCWTLGVWAAAGAPIDHVLVSLRAIDEVVRSRIALGHLAPGAAAGARNALTYAVGLCLLAAREHRLEHAVVWFPDFLRDPAGLFAAMRFPEPVPRQRFDEAFARVVDPDRAPEA
ncbi:MAG TPA: hypothetical protein VHL78_08595, partial [Actinomycetota bacterium]|nr:hypothetical protein [Actinomycetota bacterium]